MHMELPTSVALLNDFKAKANWRTCLRYSIVRVLEVQSKELTIFKIHEIVVVEVIRSELVLLL